MFDNGLFILSMRVRVCCLLRSFVIVLHTLQYSPQTQGLSIVCLLRPVYCSFRPLPMYFESPACVRARVALIVQLSLHTITQSINPITSSCHSIAQVSHFRTSSRLVLLGVMGLAHVHNITVSATVTTSRLTRLDNTGFIVYVSHSFEFKQHMYSMCTLTLTHQLPPCSPYVMASETTFVRQLPVSARGQTTSTEAIGAEYTGTSPLLHLPSIIQPPKLGPRLSVVFCGFLSYSFRYAPPQHAPDNPFTLCVRFSLFCVVALYSGDKH